MGQTTIQWADLTFNPWRGCQKVSPGCANCYAEKLSTRNPTVLGKWGPDGTRVVAAESYWRLPISWDRAAKKAGKRRRVFCASLADVFEDRDELIGPRQRLFHLIGRTPNLDWLLLTKRPENVEPFGLEQQLWYAQDGLPSNVWLGVSVEDQQRADERIPLLMRIPTKVRFLSCEPLLGPIDDLEPFLPHAFNQEPHCPWCEDCIPSDYRCGGQSDYWMRRTRENHCMFIDWVIVGGESGPRARPCDPAWIRSIVQQCTAAGVACFVKQLGSSPDIDELRDPKGGNPDEWPEDLRLREFPK